MFGWRWQDTWSVEPTFRIPVRVSPRLHQCFLSLICIISSCPYIWCPLQNKYHFLHYFLDWTLPLFGCTCDTWCLVSDSKFAMVIKRSKVRVDAYYDEDDLDELDNPSIPSHVTHQHTDFNVNTLMTGYHSCMTTTYHDVPASPQKRHSDSQPDPILDEWTSMDLSWLDRPILDEENSDHSDLEDDPSMDPRGSTEDAAIQQVGQCQTYFKHTDTIIQDDPYLQDWLPLIWDFMEEIFRHETPAGILKVCSHCDLSVNDVILYCCASCNEGCLYCAKCTVDLHTGNPLHRIHVCPNICLWKKDWLLIIL